LALEHHLNHRARYDQQVENSANYVLPFIEQSIPVQAGKNILEVGTGEGGVLKPFIERGANCVGVDLNPDRIDLANDFLKEEVKAGKVEFLLQNIYEADFTHRFTGFFDVVILKDVIEHVPEQEQFIKHLTTLLKPGGIIFFGFPPWYMPFGGHQQVCRTRWASKIPYYHILPTFIYKGLLKMAGEHDNIIRELLEIKDTQITIERFERIVKRLGLQVKQKKHYLINPIYKYKFGLQPRVQWAPITWIPYFRDFVTTCVYYNIGK
jgi:SAM-dependent methyltransferase